MHQNFEPKSSSVPFVGHGIAATASDAQDIVENVGWKNDLRVLVVDAAGTLENLRKKKVKPTMYSSWLVLDEGDNMKFKLKQGTILTL